MEGSTGLRMERPTGVTIIAILAFISGILTLVGGFGMIAAGAYLGGMAAAQGLPGFGAMFAVLGAVLVVLGLLYLVLGWGFWTGKEWAWILGVVLSIIGIIMGILSITNGGIISIIIDGIILYYLYQPHVKEFFGRA